MTGPQQSWVADLAKLAQEQTTGLSLAVTHTHARTDSSGSFQPAEAGGGEEEGGLIHGSLGWAGARGGRRGVHMQLV